MLKPLAEAIDSSHADIQCWFLYHQECLLLNCDDYAQQSWAVFLTYLKQHLAFEDSVLYPHLQAQGLELTWPVAVYQKEHQKLLGLCADIGVMLAEYWPMQARKKRLALLSVLDKQATFLRVLEHHEEREDKDMLEKMQSLDLSDLAEQWHSMNQQLLKHSSEFRKSLEVYLAGA